jgi:hypothetical protein
MATNRDKPKAPHVTSTATMTPTYACTHPNLMAGFVDYTYPGDGVVDVPREVVVAIQFNQPMKEGDLSNNIKVCGAEVAYVMRYDPGTYQVKSDFRGWLKAGANVVLEVKRNAKNMCLWRQIVLVDVEFTITKN